MSGKIVKSKDSARRLLQCVVVVLLLLGAIVSGGIVDAPVASAGGGHALMVVGSVNASNLPPSKDRPVVALLESIGFEVQLVDDDAVTVGDVAGNEVVVVSSSVVPSKIGSMFAPVPVPVVTWEGYLFDDFGFTNGVGGSQGGTSSTQTALEIVDESHRLSAGYTGTVEVLTSAQRFAYARPVPSAQIVAQIGSQSVLFGFEAGAALHDGSTAEARRVGLFMNYQGAGVLSQAGRDMVAAALGWATDTAGVPGNTAPSVNAGSDVSVASVGAVMVELDGTVTDDGRPVPPGEVTMLWSSADVGVSFVDAAAEDTAVSLPGPGSYELTLSADDSQLDASDTVTVDVVVPSNEAPTVDAGSDQSIMLPGNTVALAGMASDDGVPVPSELTTTWSQFSGPAGVTFDDSAALEVTATFPGAGQYVLQLTADDGELAASDNVTVNIDGDLPGEINVAFVASKTAPLPSGDRPIRDRLELNGATVTEIDDDALPGVYSGFDLIFVSTSVVYSKIADHFATTAVPVITTEQYLFDDMNMAAARIGVRNSATIKIQAPGHELAASNTGTVTITTAATNLGYGEPGPGATIIATASGLPVYFAYKTGDEMTNGISAPARRVAFPGTFTTAKNATITYNDLLDATIAYALTPDNLAPVAIDDDYQVDEDHVLAIAADAAITAFDGSTGGVGQFGIVYEVGITRDGKLVIPDFTNDQIQLCAIDGTMCTSFGTEGSEVGQFDGPESAAVTSDGRIVIADYQNNRVQVCETDGTNCVAFGTEGSEVGQFSEPEGVAVAADGKIFVLDSGNDRVQLCTIDGDCSAFGSEGTALGQFEGPYGLALTSDGRIVVADTDNSRVQVCSFGGDCTAFDGSLGGAGEFSAPADVAITADGRVLVVDYDLSMVQVCTIDGTHCTLLGTYGSDLGEFYEPYGVAVTSDGRFVVADTDNERIQVFAPGGVLVNDSDPEAGSIEVTSFDTTSVEGAVVAVNTDGSFSYDPTNAAAAQALNDREALTDTFTYTITDGISTATATVTVTVVGADENQAPVAVDDDGYQVGEDAVLNVGQTMGFSEFYTADLPRAVAATADGRVLYLLQDTDQVFVCAQDFLACTDFGVSGAAVGQFDSPAGVAVTADGKVVIADGRNHRVQVCEIDGTNCVAFGSNGATVGQFASPAGVAVDGDGKIVVADTGNHRIQVCALDGTCTSFGGPGTAVGEFSTPMGVAVTSAGQILIADSGNNRVQVCSPAGVCSILGSAGQFGSPAGLTVTADGRIIVADDDTHRIHICSPDASSCLAIGGYGTALGKFFAPRAVAVTSDGHIVVVDYVNGRLQTVSPGGVLPNDSDPEGDTISVLSFDASSVQGASVIVNADGSFSYDPTLAVEAQNLNNGETLTDTFGYTIFDGNATSTATVTVTVVGFTDIVVP